MATANPDVAGVWNLARWGRTCDGGPFAPFPGAKGRLIYDASGFVAAQLERESLSKPGQQQIYSYSGTWRIEDGTAHHVVDLSNIPDWIGATLTRTVLLLDATRLHLETPPVRACRGDLRDILEWVRADGRRDDG